MATQRFAGFVLGGVVALLVAPAFAQFDGAAADPVPRYNGLRTPDSPAAVLLGTASDEVQRPSSVRSLAIQLGNSFVRDSTLVLPDNYALEFAPYWLFGHPRLELAQFVKENWRSFYQNLTLSLATTRLDETVTADDGTTTAVTNAYLAVGLRTTLYENRHWPCVDELYKALAEWNERVTTAKSEKAAELEAAGADEATLKAALAEVEASLQAEFTADAEACRAEVAARRGFALDLASAFAFRFPDGEFDAGEFTSAAVWLAPAYLWRQFSVVGLVRYRADQVEAAPGRHVLDLGARLVYAIDRFGVAAEGLYRRRLDAHRGEEANLYRADVTFDVAIGDGFWFAATFGRAFEGSDASSLLALANLKFDLGQRRMLVGGAPSGGFPSNPTAP